MAFYATKDGARTWQQSDAEGIALGEGDLNVGQLLVSPRFHEDGAVYLQTSKGLHVSVDEGQTFSLVDSLAPSEAGWDRLTPYVDATGSSGEETLSFAWANSVAPARLSPPFHVPVAGTPTDEAMFLIPDGTDVALEETFAFASDVDETGAFITQFFSCVYPFNCAQPLFTFPENLLFEDAWLDPRSGTPTIVVALRAAMPKRGRIEVWRSTDSGRSFSEWRSVNKLIRTKAELHSTKVDLAFNAARKEAYLQVSLNFDDVDPPSPPAERIFRSRGATDRWGLVAFGRSGGQPGKRGELWDDSSVFGLDLELMADGTVMAIAMKGMAARPYCSTDRGRSWSHFC